MFLQESVSVGVKTDPLHVEGERLPASGFRFSPAQHHVGVAHLAGVDISGRERSFDLTCRAREEEEEKEEDEERSKKVSENYSGIQKVLAETLRFC